MTGPGARWLAQSASAGEWRGILPSGPPVASTCAGWRLAELDHLVGVRLGERARATVVADVLDVATVIPIDA